MKAFAAFLVVIAILIAVLVGLLIWMNSTQLTRYDSFRGNCSAADGHIYKPDAVAWCVSTDGRIVEVYP